MIIHVMLLLFTSPRDFFHPTVFATMFDTIVAVRGNGYNYHHEALTIINSRYISDHSVTSGVRRSEHITPVLEDLHWTPASHWVVFKTALVVWKCVHGVAPAYLSDLCVPATVGVSRKFCHTENLPYSSFSHYSIHILPINIFYRILKYYPEVPQRPGT